MQKSSTAVPLRNALSPLEQIVQSEAKIRMVRRIFGMCKFYNSPKILDNLQNLKIFSDFAAKI